MSGSTSTADERRLCGWRCTDTLEARGVPGYGDERYGDERELRNAAPISHDAQRAPAVPDPRRFLTLLPADSLIPQEFRFGSSVDLTREFTLTGLRDGVSYYYFVTVIDASGNITQSVSYGEFHTRAF